MRAFSALGGMVILSASGVARAVPVQWPSASGGNDHFYEFLFAQGIEWADAQVAAAARTFNGRSGYLATLTSAAEDAFVDSNFAPLYIEAWAGAFQSPNKNPAPTKGWQWITGESWSFTDWAAGEPNDFQGPEFLLSIGGDLNQPQFQRSWNDDGNGTDQRLKTGYLVEYPVPPSNPGDLDGNDTVNGTDLGVLLLLWGHKGQTIADLNDDGLVDGADLGLLLLNWTG